VVQPDVVVVLDRSAEGEVDGAFVRDVGVHAVDAAIGGWRGAGGCGAEVGEGGGEAGGAKLGEVVGC